MPISKSNEKQLLSLENVSKSFDLGGVKLEVLKNVSLKINAGEFVAIMGPSGSGKSTLMYLIGLLDTPTSGEVVLEGKKVSGLPENALAKIRNQKIGFVFQSFNLLSRTSALSNVLLPTIYSNLPPSEAEKRAKELLAKLGLTARQDHFPNQLSGGEQQRVAIARALINEPSLILADEPTGNLDTKTGREVVQIFRDLNRDGNTIIFVTHDMNVAKHARRIIRIQDGKII